jgi:hypothetical protein
MNFHQELRRLLKDIKMDSCYRHAGMTYGLRLPV